MQSSQKKQSSTWMNSTLHRCGTGSSYSHGGHLVPWLGALPDHSSREVLIPDRFTADVPEKTQDVPEKTQSSLGWPWAALGPTLDVPLVSGLRQCWGQSNGASPIRIFGCNLSTSLYRTQICSWSELMALIKSANPTWCIPGSSIQSREALLTPPFLLHTSFTGQLISIIQMSQIAVKKLKAQQEKT